MSRSSRLQDHRRAQAPCLTLVALVALLHACAQKVEQAAPAQAASGPAGIPDVTLEKGSSTVVPDAVDSELFGELRRITKSCKVNFESSAVECARGEMDTLKASVTSGERSRAKVLETVAFAFAQGREDLTTVTADFMGTSLSAPPKRGDAPSKEAAKALVATLATLPLEQALDAVPAVVHAASQTGLEAELYRVLDDSQSRRLRLEAYRHLLETGEMRLFEKVQALAKQDSLDLGVTAIEAARRMPDKTPEQAKQICDWARDLSKDSRAVVALRAKTLVVGCGEPYFEGLLAEDEQRIAKQEAISAADLHLYALSCARGAERSPNDATEAQCARLEKLLKAVDAGERFDQAARDKAREMLQAQFGKS